jgi:hypothetical protein
MHVALGLAMARPALAQPQDDAKLADDEAPKPEAQSWSQMGPGASFGDTPAPAPEPADQPPLSTEQLRALYPDLELQATPAHVRLTVFFGSIYPFLLAGGGIGADIEVAPRWRLSSFAAAGLTTAWNSPSAGVFVELSTGFSVLRWLRETSVAVPEPVRWMSRHAPEEGRKMLRAVVPTSHSVEVEGGALVGSHPLYRCTDNCDDPDLDKRTVQQEVGYLTVPFVGLRYSYYRWARSSEGAFRSTSRFEAEADLLTKPISNPASDLLNAQGKAISESPVGGRVVLKIPTSACTGACLGLDLMGGYLPSPSSALFSASLVVY